MNISGSISIFSNGYIPVVSSGGGTSYLLDTYTAAAAYSLRQLKTGVTNVVRVRRSGDLAESDFTADEITDGTLLSWVTASGTFGGIVTWYDQSGNGNDLTQSTAINQPRIVNGSALVTKGSLPAVLFDGSNDSLDDGFGGSIINTTSTSYFSVSAASVGNTVGIIHCQTNAGTLYSIRTFCDARAAAGRNLVVTNSTPTNYLADLSTFRNDTNQRLLSSFIDSSKNMSAFDNGATGGTATYTGTVTDNNGLSLGVQSGATYLAGYIQEFIAFNTDESANRIDIESDINTYYSIY